MSHYGNDNDDERGDGTLFVAAGLTPLAAAATESDTTGLSSTLSSSLHRFMGASANHHRRMAVSTHDDDIDDEDDNDDDEDDDEADDFRDEDDVEANAPRAVNDAGGQNEVVGGGQRQAPFLVPSISPQQQGRCWRCLYFFVMLVATLVSFWTMETCHFMTTTHLLEDDGGEPATAVGLYRYYAPELGSCVAYTASTLPAPSSRISQITALFAFVGGILVVVGVLGGCAVASSEGGAPPAWTRPVSLALPFLQVMTLMLLLDSNYCRASSDDVDENGDNSEMCAMNRGSWFAIVASFLYSWASLLLIYWINQPRPSTETSITTNAERDNAEEGGEQLNGGRINFEDIPYNPPPKLSSDEELQQEIAKMLSIKKIEGNKPSTTSRTGNNYTSTFSAIFGSSSADPDQNEGEITTTESDEDEVITSSERTGVTTLLMEDDDNEKDTVKRGEGNTDVEQNERDNETTDDQQKSTLSAAGKHVSEEKDQGTIPRQELATRADRPENKEGDDDEAVCAICMVEYEEGDEVCFSSHCPHTFHRDCMIPWLVRQKRRRQEILWNHYREHFGTVEVPDLPPLEGNECPCCRQSYVSTTANDNNDSTSTRASEP